MPFWDPLAFAITEAHARNLEFEKAAQVRDQLGILKAQAFGAPGGDNVVPLIRA